MNPTHSGRWRPFLLVLTLILAATEPLLAQEWKSNPRDLVHRAIDKQAKQSEQPRYFMFRDTKRKKDGTVETKEMLQTPEVLLGRLVAIDGRPLTPEQRNNEDARLNRLVNDSKELRNKKEEQQEDSDRALRMLRALPEAFDYQYVGTEETPSGPVAVLKFTPNPNWDAPNRELQVFTGMSGTMKIVVGPERLMLIQAELFKDVGFGWGILGKLYKGGSFRIQQSEVTPGDWEVTHMKLNFNGKVLLFKSLHIQQDETTSDYRTVPPMTVAQAIDRLRQSDIEFARDANANGGK